MSDNSNTPTSEPEPSWAQRCIFTVAQSGEVWWLDRVNPDGCTAQVCGPFRDEIEAHRRANWINRVNQGWEAAT